MILLIDKCWWRRSDTTVSVYTENINLKINIKPAALYYNNNKPYACHYVVEYNTAECKKLFKLLGMKEPKQPEKQYNHMYWTATGIEV